jgi:hypothetical protein
MSEDKEMTLLEVVSQLSDIMPAEVEPDHLAAFVLTILHGYMDTEDVIVFLRGMADVCEKNEELITKNVEKHKDNVADES